MINKIVPYLKKNILFIHTYKKFKWLIKKVRYSHNKLFSSEITEDRLFEEFNACGIYPGDKIVVNSSLSSIGYIKGGAGYFVEVLKKYITEDGLIVMPSYPHKGMYEYLENYKFFDVNVTPSQNGIVTEIFRKSKNVYRSLHPTHPLCFWGENAEELSEGHEKSKSPYDLDSPFKKLLDLDVKNFCIGVNFEHMIMIRVIDDLHNDYPAHMYIENKIYKVPVKNKSGQIVEVETKCHDPEKAAFRNNMNLYPYMQKDIICGYLGKAKTIVLSSKKMFNYQVELAKRGIFPYYDVSFIKTKSIEQKT